MRTIVHVSTSILKGSFSGIDARQFQISYLGFFLLFGTLILGWDTQFQHVSLILGTCLLTQYLFIVFGKAHPRSWMSAIITSLGLCLLFRANDPMWYISASVLAISSKFMLRFNSKHFFNPANFGMIIVMLLSGDGWISPGQWGSSVIFLFVLGALGSFVLLRVGRMDMTSIFLITFVGLEFCRSVLYLGWGVDVLLHRLTSGSFLLFAFFMITDPKSTPDHPRARKMWAFLVGLTAFGLSTFSYIHTAPIWALFFLSPASLLFDRIYKSERFHWLSEKPLQSITS